MKSRKAQGANAQLNNSEPLPEYAVKFDNVSFSYSDDGGFALKDVSFEVKRGEFLAILGHNGSGKSTLARLICGLIDADKGKVLTWGLDPSDKDCVSRVRRHAGIVFQNPDNQMVASIVEDDVAFGPENIGLEREEIGRRIEWALDAVGMSEYRRSTPTRLSGGQKQRIAVAGVLALKPDVLILDEATAMLDPKGRSEVMTVAKKLNEQEGITVIIITHFMEEALLCDRALVMNKGEIVLSGTPQEIFLSGDGLETYNLCLPEIGEICRDLKEGGMDIQPCLYPGQLAQSIAQNLNNRKESVNTFGDIRLPSEKSGEWDITIENLNFTYSKKSPFATHALKGVNLTIGEGEFFGIIGHTGSGKSTLVQHLNALIKLPQAEKHYKKPKVKKGQTPPLQPSIKIGKYDLKSRKCDWRALRADVGMVFQYPEYQLFAETVFDDVAFGLKNFRPDLSKEEVAKAVRESLTAVGLDYDRIHDKSPFDLSGGQKRRVAIAGVIVTKPHILILDEPAAGLDPLGKREIMRLLHFLHSDWCKTVVIVSHDMDEIAENCTRACVLSSGSIFACDTPARLFDRAEELKELGLDCPLTTKLKRELSARGIRVDCGCTADDFTQAVLQLYCGEGGDGNA